LQITVTGTGPDIPPGLHSCVFEKFYGLPLQHQYRPKYFRRKGISPCTGMENSRRTAALSLATRGEASAAHELPERLIEVDGFPPEARREFGILDRV
jgi:hypothetical protein